MKRIVAQDLENVRNLEQRLGSLTLRTILTGEDQRLMRPERMSNLLAGRGKISERESNVLRKLRSNSVRIETLKSKSTSDERKGLKRKEWKVNRALRDRVLYGRKEGGTRVGTPDQDQRGVRALRFFGVDPEDGTYYMKE